MNGPISGALYAPNRASAAADLDEASGFLAHALGDLENARSALRYASRCIANATFREAECAPMIAAIEAVEREVRRLMEWTERGAPEG